MTAANLPESFEDALQSLTQWFDAEQVPYTAIGGLAVSLIAQPRATQDIDAVVWLDANRWEAFIRAGEAHGFTARLDGMLEFAARSRVFLLRHRSGVSVDISCGALPFEKEMIERAIAVRVGRIQLKVPTPEDLIITKAVAQRAKDFIDIESILRTHEDLDLARVRRWTREFASALEMPEMSETLERLLKESSG